MAPVAPPVPAPIGICMVAGAFIINGEGTPPKVEEPEQL